MYGRKNYNGPRGPPPPMGAGTARMGGPAPPVPQLPEIDREKVSRGARTQASAQRGDGGLASGCKSTWHWLVGRGAREASTSTSVAHLRQPTHPPSPPAQTCPLLLRVFPKVRTRGAHKRRAASQRNDIAGRGEACRCLLQRELFVLTRADPRPACTLERLYAPALLSTPHSRFSFPHPHPPLSGSV